MDVLTSILVGIALAMDCFAVSVCIGGISRIGIKEYVKTSFLFGFFQFAMVVIGYYLGSSIESLITSLDHWIAFILLSVIGVKLIYESMNTTECADLTTNKKLLMFSLATSIDAFAVGIAISLVNGSIWMSASIIGVVSVIATVIGIRIGQTIKGMKRNYAGIIGGIFLIFLGLKILIEHMLL